MPHPIQILFLRIYWRDGRAVKATDLKSVWYTSAGSNPAPVVFTVEKTYFIDCYPGQTSIIPNAMYANFLNGSLVIHWGLNDYN